MAGAVEELRAAAHSIPRSALGCRFVANRDGRAVDGDAIPSRIAEQLVHPVQWQATLRTVGELGATDLVAVGPGRTLRALARASLGGMVRLHATEDALDLERTRRELA
jgi:malonyl CoA-acyl carrier protein transacylase